MTSKEKKAKKAKKEAKYKQERPSQPYRSTFTPDPNAYTCRHGIWSDRRSGHDCEEFRERS